MHANKPTIRYTIDAEDRVTFVDAEWMSFAAENGAPELTSANVVGKPIWGILADEEVNHLYALMFATVRARGRKLTLPFRCDSPTSRRFMELTVTPLNDGSLDVASTLVREESRAHVDLLGSGARDPDRFLKICSWCKRVLLESNAWVEVESAVRELNLFESQLLPGLTHGMCPECDSSMRARIDGG